MISRSKYMISIVAIAFLIGYRPSADFFTAFEYPEVLVKSNSDEFFKYGCPQYNLIREHEGYVVCYDPRTKNPYWTYEVLTKEKLSGSANRSHAAFQADPSFPKIHRAELTDFKNSSYDRGHLVAAGNHKSSQDSMNETFLLTNISPMHQDVNRRLWKRLEEWVREQTLKKDSKTHVVSGVLFLPYSERLGQLYVRYLVLGKNQVAVPTHFFKAVLFETNEGKIEKKAFLIPNDLTDKRNSFWDFQVTLEKIEEISGLLLFQLAGKAKVGF